MSKSCPNHYPSSPPIIFQSLYVYAKILAKGKQSNALLLTWLFLVTSYTEHCVKWIGAQSFSSSEASSFKFPSQTPTWQSNMNAYVKRGERMKIVGFLFVCFFFLLIRPQMWKRKEKNPHSCAGLFI